jgi:benzoyl-CoA reductase subunit B
MNWNKIGWLSDKFVGYDACMVAGRYTHMAFWQEPQVIEKIIEHCDFYELDGLILYAARTCRAFSYPQYLIADAVGKRLGLPVAMFEDDMVDETFYMDEVVNSRV